MATTTGPTRRTRTRRIRALGVLGATLALLSLGAGSASATITERSGRVTQTYSFVSWDWDCGYPMQVDGTTTDQVQVRVDRKDPRIVFVTDNYQFTETRTVADGRSFTLAGNGLNKDVRAKRVSGSLYEFTFHNPGQPFTIRDSSGNLISRDRGHVDVQYTINLDDGSFNFLGVRFSGPHPSAGVDGCQTVAPLVGSASASYLTPRPVGSTTFPMGFYEYLPPSYTASGAKSPLLLAFNGYGESGDGSPEQLPNLLNTGIPRFINIGGWPTDRPLVVLALQHHESRRASTSRRATASRGAARATCRSSTTAAMCSPRSARRPMRSTTSSTTRSPTTTSTRSACTSRACRAARTACGSTSRSTTVRCRWLPPSRSRAMLDRRGRQATAASVRHRCGRSTASSTTS